MCTIENEIIKGAHKLEISVSRYMHNNLSNDLTTAKTMTTIDTLENHNISDRQLDIIHLIITNNVNTVSSLAKYLGLSTSSMSTVISKMTNQKLLDKVPDEKDGRAVTLVPTEHAILIYSLFKNIFSESFTDFINRLNKKELSLFDDCVENISNALTSSMNRTYSRNLHLSEKIDFVFETLFLTKKNYETFFRNTKSATKDDLLLTPKEMMLYRLIIEGTATTPSEISKITCTGESTISTQLKKMLKKGLIYKQKDSKDSRKTYFLTTDYGAKIFYESCDIVDNTFLEFLKNITIEKKESILESLKCSNTLFELLLKH